ncbi:hypothetical protein HW132_35725, partial [Brasilonema sp. CT11]|nr:hypothetical protein [Brasilonema sp. CT11]
EIHSLIILIENHDRNKLLSSPAPKTEAKAETEQKKPAQPKQKQQKKPKADNKNENKKQQDSVPAVPGFSFLFGTSFEN